MEVIGQLHAPASLPSAGIEQEVKWSGQFAEEKIVDTTGTRTPNRLR
jgi:hypothetical protein